MQIDTLSAKAQFRGISVSPKRRAVTRLRSTGTCQYQTLLHSVQDSSRKRLEPLDQFT